MKFHWLGVQWEGTDEVNMIILKSSAFAGKRLF